MNAQQKLKNESLEREQHYYESGQAEQDELDEMYGYSDESDY
jgi:hypothetical protein